MTGKATKVADIPEDFMVHSKHTQTLLEDQHSLQLGIKLEDCGIQTEDPTPQSNPE